MSEDIVQVENDKAALIFGERKTAQILHTVCSILLCLHGQRSPKIEAVLIKRRRDPVPVTGTPSSLRVRYTLAPAAHMY